MTGTEPPRAGKTSKPQPDDKHDRADSGQSQLEQEVGHELAHLLVTALSGDHGRFGSSSP
jgi:hypothetical protein